MITTVGDIEIIYPDLGFAFNPIRIFVNNYTVEDSLILESNGIKIEKEPYQETTTVTFELSAIAKSLFDRLQFYKIEENDTTLYKVLSFVIKNSSGIIYEGSIPVIWGALQIGETYTQNKTLTYFKGFPFTVPLYTEQTIVLKANGVEYKTLSPGKHNIDISDISSSGNIHIEGYDEVYRKTFDYTFDYTFGPQRILLGKDLSIDINVVDCPSDGVYLRWINKYGEYNYYLFQSSNQSITTKNNSIAYDSIFYRVSLTDNYHFGTGKSIGKDAEETIKLYAPLVDSITFDLLLGLIESPVVDMFLGYDSENRQNWISVSVSEGTFVKGTSELQDFELYMIPNKRQLQTL